MNRFANIIVILLSCLSISCSDHQKNPDRDTPPEFKAKYVENILLSEYFEKMEYVILEECDDGLFMNADRIEYFEDHWYIFDKQLMTVLCFESDGTFKFRIHDVGKGPGEYQYPTCMLIHKAKREIWIQCFRSQRLIRYDLEGNFKDDLKVRAGTDMIQFNDEEVILFDEEYFYFNDKDSTYPGLLTLGDNFKRKDQFFEIQYDILLNVLQNNRCLSMNNDSCYLVYASDSLLSFSQNKKSHVEGVFNFGKHHLPDELRSLERRTSNYDFLTESGKVLMKDYLLANSDYFMLTLGLQNEYWYGIVDRKTNDFVVTQGFINDIQSKPFVFPSAKKSENELVGFMSADYTIALKESIERLAPDKRGERLEDILTFANIALEKSGYVLVTLTLKNKNNK